MLITILTGNFLLKKQVDRKCWKFVENMQEEALLNDCDYFGCAGQINMFVIFYKFVL